MTTDDFGRRMWRIIYPILIYFGVYYLIYVIAGILGMTISVIDMEKSGAEMDVYVLIERTYHQIESFYLPINLGVGIIMVPILILLRKLDRKRRGDTAVYENVPVPFYLACAGLGAAACLAINGMLIISRLTAVMSEDLEQVGNALYRGQFFFELIVVGLLLPAVEELLFRGLIEERLKEWMRVEMAIFFTAVLFAMYHGNMLQVIYTFLLGLLLGFVYERFHNIVASIVLHAAANIVSVTASETGILDSVLIPDNEITLMIFTGICCVVVVLMIYLVYEKVKPAVLRRPEL